MERVLAIQNHEGLCWKCLESYDKSDIHTIRIHEMGYGSQFDGESTEIHLCNDCYNKSIEQNNELWSMEEVHDLFESGDYKYGEEYKYEDEMIDYIRNLPIQGRQFVENEFTNGWNTSYKMDAQDWMDYKLGILPHEKCKEYGRYSPDEIKAYEEKFPTCQLPVNVVYEDGSKGCRCPFGASGDYGQKCGLNISSKCYECICYLKRTTPTLDIDSKDFSKYENEVKFIFHHPNLTIKRKVGLKQLINKILKR